MVLLLLRIYVGSYEYKSLYKFGRSDSTSCCNLHSPRNFSRQLDATKRKRNKYLPKTLQSNKIKLVPMIAGFILNSIGIYVLSITYHVINPDGSLTGSVWHPLFTQGFVIF
jgi:hypothetical protein